MMAPPELLEIGSHCCYGGTVYRFETWPANVAGGRAPPPPASSGL